MTNGHLTAGERLPSTRALAATLGISRTVVTGAYAQLFAEGWIEGRHGSGTYVADGASASDGASAFDGASRTDVGVEEGAEGRGADAWADRRWQSGNGGRQPGNGGRQAGNGGRQPGNGGRQAGNGGRQ